MKRILSSLMRVLAVLSGCAAPSPASGTGSRTYRQITMQEAAQLMKTEQNYILLDVRSDMEYSAGHIPGAVLLPNETIGSDPIPQLPDKDQLIMVYCRSGNRSKQAAEKLVRLGYTNVVEIGGIHNWEGDIVTE